MICGPVGMTRAGLPILTPVIAIPAAHRSFEGVMAPGNVLAHTPKAVGVSCQLGNTGVRLTTMIDADLKNIE